MKERPILFNAAMVQSILKGRKTQTRRIVKAKKGADCPDYMWVDQYALKDVIEWREQNNRWFGCKEYRTLAFSDCPYGQIGDRLWVRETTIISPPNWLAHDDVLDHPDIIKDSKGEHRVVQYIASNPDTDVPVKDYKLRKTPSIHMPRWASRIFLEITNIRIERLNDISEADCIAEGMGSPILRDCKKPKFIQLWTDINGADSWAQNPWVWVIEFKVIQGERL